MRCLTTARRAALWAAAALLFAGGAAGCAEDTDPNTTQCVEGQKCDTPDDAPEDSCTKRRRDALEGNQSFYAPDAIRWPCADVEGVNTLGQDDRGQEYCEYFAVLKAPPQTEGGDWPETTTLGRITTVEEGDLGGYRVETTPAGVELTEDQIFYFEDFPDETLAQCIFTSWHMDVEGAATPCEGTDCPEVLGLPVDSERFRMRLPSNSNVAASELVRECLETIPRIGDPEDSEDRLHGDFYRGCILVSELYGTEWRRSDPAVCAAAMRLAECGCALPDAADVPTSLVPPQPQTDADGNPVVTMRGFPLGAWSGLDTLPAGCKRVADSELGPVVVACDLTGNEVIEHASDLKRLCLEKYGRDVVVHVPIPAEAITCTPPEGGDYAETCSAQPWVIDN